METAALDIAFAALADPTRRALVARLMAGPATVTDLSQPFRMSQPAISRHLKVLEQAGLIETRIQGTARPRSLRPEALKLAFDWLSDYRTLWDTRFAALDAVLTDLITEPETQDDTP